MAPDITSHHYGKSDVRVTKVTRHTDRHELSEINVSLSLQGDFAETYTVGDNRRIVATDSMRNTIYLLAKDHPLDSIESFGIHLTQHFVNRYTQVTGASVEIELSRWERIITNGKPHPHSFFAGSPEKRICQVSTDGKKTDIRSGIKNCEVLKTTDSLFKDFVRDEFTTLPDAEDRIFATKINATWLYSTHDLDWNAGFDKVRQALLDVFCEHRSLSVQQTMYAMAECALEVCPSMQKIELTLPNKHRIPFNMLPFGKENKNDIFITTSEPFGDIFLEVGRK